MAAGAVSAGRASASLPARRRWLPLLYSLSVHIAECTAVLAVSELMWSKRSLASNLE
jgi:hypothetical protein